MYNKYYKSSKIKTPLEKVIIRQAVKNINEASVNLTDREYKRLLGKLIKHIYILRNIDYQKKKASTDFNSEKNPSKKRARRLSKTTTDSKYFSLKVEEETKNT